MIPWELGASFTFYRSESEAIFLEGIWVKENMSECEVKLAERNLQFSIVSFDISVNQ